MRSMLRKIRPKRSRPLPDALKLSKGAAPYYPIANALPTRKSVKLFVSKTRSHPGRRLEVLTALRWQMSADSTGVLGWLALWVAVLTVYVAAPFDAALRLVLTFVVVGFALVLLVAVANHLIGTDRRKRQAAVWLAAYEDAIARDEAKQS